MRNQEKKREYKMIDAIDRSVNKNEKTNCYPCTNHKNKTKYN